MIGSFGDLGERLVATLLMVLTEDEKGRHKEVVVEEAHPVRTVAAQDIVREEVGGIGPEGGVGREGQEALEDTGQEVREDMGHGDRGADREEG